MLTNVIYGFINMTHGKILKHRTSHADQYSRCLNQKAQHRYRSCCRDGRSVQYFQASSIPLYPRSQKNWYQRSDSRTKDCIYCQIISESDSSVKGPCKIIRDEFKRNRYPGLRKNSIQRPEAWLKDTPKKSSLIFVLTDYQPRKLRWHINF